MLEHAWSWTLHREMRSDVDEGHRLIEQLLAALTKYGWDGKDFFHVQLATEEAMVNAVTHGNQQASDKSVELEFRVSDKAAYVRIRDEGAGFAPADLPDPRDDDHLECTNGRGVMLIQAMMDSVTYSPRGNEVVMIKHREGSDNDA